MYVMDTDERFKIAKLVIYIFTITVVVYFNLKAMSNSEYTKQKYILGGAKIEKNTSTIQTHTNINKKMEEITKYINNQGELVMNANEFKQLLVQNPQLLSVIQELIKNGKISYPYKRFFEPHS